MLNYGDVYTSSHGTIYLDVINDNGENFFIEVGSKTVGCFYEKDNEFDSLKFDNKNSKYTIQFINFIVKKWLY